jgi:hypothetical protein
VGGENNITVVTIFGEDDPSSVTLSEVNSETFV